MDMQAINGLAIFVGIFATYTFVLLGCLERRLKKVGAVVDDLKYVN